MGLVLDLTYPNFGLIGIYIGNVKENTIEISYLNIYRFRLQTTISRRYILITWSTNLVEFESHSNSRGCLPGQSVAKFDQERLLYDAIVDFQQNHFAKYSNNAN